MSKRNKTEQPQTDPQQEDVTTQETPMDPFAPFGLTDEQERTARFKRFLTDLDGARDHLRESQRHLFLGLSEIARVASQHLGDLPDSASARVGEGAATVVYSILELAAAKIQPLSAETDLRVEARMEALANLRALMKAEQERYNEQEQPHKVDAAQAIIDAITREMERVVQEPSQPTTTDNQPGMAQKIHIRTATDPN